MSLRGYQTAQLDRGAAAFTGGARSVLHVLPTGGGKTMCFTERAAQDRAAGTSHLIVAHRRELIRQASQKLTARGVRHGVIAPGFAPNPACMIQVGSVQTVSRRELQPFERITVDEAHHATAGGWTKLFAAQPRARIEGWTATPERLDGRGLGAVFDTLVVGPSIGWLIGEKFLAACTVYAPPAGPDMRGVRTLAGDWSAEELAAIMDAPSVTGDAAEHYFWHCPGVPAIVFCASVAHAKHTAEAFAAAGWRARHVSGAMDVAERDAAIAGLATGQVEVLTSCELISEGLDIPAVGCVILLRPTKSLGLYMQMVGRGMRIMAGKRRLIVLDHAGNVLRHGMPDADRDWSLEGRTAATRTAPAVRQCSNCYAIHRPAPRCPCCGHTDIAAPGAAVAGPRQLTGLLAELTADDPRLVRLRTAPLPELVRQARGYSALLEIEEARDFKPGWAQGMLERKAALHQQYRRKAA